MGLKEWREQRRRERAERREAMTSGADRRFGPEPNSRRLLRRARNTIHWQISEEWKRPGPVFIFEAAKT
jgi:hypothetical protein